jgi:outer membrane biosynthesis protein TonB
MKARERPGKKSLLASLMVHVLAIFLAWGAQVSSAEPPDFISYEITLVSPPPALEAEIPQPAPAEEVAVETPDPVTEEEPPPVVEEERREEERPTPTPTPPPEVAEESGDPEPSEELGGEDLNVRMEGLRRDFPVYYQNIIAQIGRCMRFTGSGRWETTIFFYIDRDGMVDGGELRFVERSGNVDFDYAAMGAVECAGSGRFGPLPEELQLDRIPILFTFRPRGDREETASGPLDGMGHPYQDPPRLTRRPTLHRRPG